jgi:glutamate racemase
MKPSERAPIGIFDSGIGGLTVANAIKAELPNESLLYFGDTAHFPYGEKSPESIRSYAVKISDFLLERGAKMIVIACNTASSHAFNAVCDNVGNRAQVINVIDPVVAEVARGFPGGRVGVIGTKGTIKSDVYATKLIEKDTSLNVGSLATPLLAPMVEEGFFNNKISRTVINSYLVNKKLKNVEALILACTHYPLIKLEIEEYYNGKVKIVDSAEIVARYVKDSLATSGLLNKKTRAPHHFFVSDYTPSFEKSSRIFFKGRIKLEHFHLWNE